MASLLKSVLGLEYILAFGIPYTFKNQREQRGAQREADKWASLAALVFQFTHQVGQEMRKRVSGQKADSGLKGEHVVVVSPSGSGVR